MVPVIAPGEGSDEGVSLPPSIGREDGREVGREGGSKATARTSVIFPARVKVRS